MSEDLRKIAEDIVNDETPFTDQMYGLSAANLNRLRRWLAENPPAVSDGPAPVPEPGVRCFGGAWGFWAIRPDNKGTYFKTDTRYGKPHMEHAGPGSFIGHKEISPAEALSLIPKDWQEGRETLERMLNADYLRTLSDKLEKAATEEREQCEQIIEAAVAKDVLRKLPRIDNPNDLPENWGRLGR